MPGFNYLLNATDFNVVVNALQGITRVNVISSPNITVMDNRAAKLQVGDQVPIVKQTGQSALAAGAPILNQIEMKDTGVILSVTPRVNKNGLVVLDINQEVSDVVPTTTSSINSPTIRQRRPNGLVLVTGPTGSGKTTTLYAALRGLNGSHLKVVTVEDPVEYRMAGVNQVHPGIGLDFAAALRSILRQDPDVVMVGEIRDAEIARIAVQASLTGHLVISTLHTNSAPATVTRLVDMGVERFLIAATLTGVVAQRLVRRVCAACAAPGEATSEERARLGQPADGPPLRLLRARGCAACNGSGYRGRGVVSEVMTLDAELRALICGGADEQTLTTRARAAGMATLAETARATVLADETTLDEIGRVFEGQLFEGWPPESLHPKGAA